MKNSLSYLLLLCISILLFSCDKDDDMEKQVVGTWQLTALEIDGNRQDISTDKDILQFQSNSIFIRYTVSTEEQEKGGWSISGDMLNISLDLPAAYYIERLTASEMIIKRLDFKENGELKNTILTYQRVSNDLIP